MSIRRCVERCTVGRTHRKRKREEREITGGPECMSMIRKGKKKMKKAELKREKLVIIFNCC
jgi:hypothetical protein